MAKKATPAVVLRKCVGSKTFGIEPHEVPSTEFPIQPSQKDGLGVMCKPHWTQYVKALRERAKAAKVIHSDAIGLTGAARDEAKAILDQAKQDASVAQEEATKARNRARVIDATETQKQEIAALEKQLASAGGVGTDAGQAILEAAANRSAAMRVGRRDGADLDPQAVEI